MAELENFASFLLLEKQLKTNTIRKVSKVVRILIKHKAIETPLTFKNYLLTKKEAGAKNSYLNHIIYSARLYTEYRGIKGFDSLKTFKKEPTQKGVFSLEELKKFLDCPKYRGVTQEVFKKQTLIFKLLALTGMRPIEVGKLTKDRFLWGRNQIEILETKNNTNRYIPIPPNLKVEMQDYLKDKGVDENPFYIEGTSLNNTFKKRCKYSGIELRKGLSVYSLRHTYATVLCSEDLNLHKIARLMGHKQIATTVQYTHLVSKDLEESIIKHPLIAENLTPEKQLTLIYETMKKVEEQKRLNFKFEKGKKYLKLKVWYND